MGVNMDPKALRQIDLAVRRVQRLASSPAPPAAHSHTAGTVGPNVFSLGLVLYY